MSGAKPCLSFEIARPRLMSVTDVDDFQFISAAADGSGHRDPNQASLPGTRPGRPLRENVASRRRASLIRSSTRSGGTPFVEIGNLRSAFRVGSGDHLLEFSDNISSGYAFATIELCNPFLHIEDLGTFTGEILRCDRFQPRARTSPPGPAAVVVESRLGK